MPLDPDFPAPAVMVITVPGLGGSADDHWQTIWERARSDTKRAELGDWDNPKRDIWVARLDEAVRRASNPVVLVGHSLGCVTIALWAARLGAARYAVVKAALLVAPADVERSDAPGALRQFTPIPDGRLPFPSTLVASIDDPWTTVDRARAFADAWGSAFIDVGAAGHLNADSRLGAWPAGEALLDKLISEGSASP